jgi:tRNA(Ile)-lysidine synthetase-like protein
MSDLFKTIRNTIDRHNLLPRGGMVVVGVSGGPDSLCLLHVLRALAPEYSVLLHVAHLNHQLRDVSSDEDATFVAQLTAQWGLPCTIESRDVAAYAEREKLAVEEAARQMRYGFLAEVARRVGSDTIAVAHHADDQAESVLMHVIRGSGIAGLRGMRPKSEIGDLKLDIGYSVLGAAPNTQFPIPNIQLVRPLLYVTRSEIEAYCAVHDLHPRFDMSNLDQTYFRNWLRHTVLPLLAQHNPGVRDVLCRTAEVAAADYDLLHQEMERAWAQVVRVCDGAIVFDLAAWQALPLALKRATIREAIHRLRRNLRNINFVHVERAVEVAGRGGVGDRATLAEGLMLSVTYDSFTIADEAQREPLPNWPLLEPGARVAVNAPGRSHLPGTGWALESELLAIGPGFRDNPDPWTAFLDAEVCAGPLMLRTRLPGDRIAPQGMGGHHVKLNEMMINAQVPRHARDRMPLLVCGQAVPHASILWACGLRLDGRACVTAATRRVLRLRFVMTD